MFSNSMHRYLNKYSSPASDYLQQISLKTQKESPGAFHMISGNLIGSLLRFLVKLSQAKLVLDVGTFVGFSALACAEALQEGGQVITCERIDQHYVTAKQNIENHPNKDRVTLFHGDAMDCIDQIDVPIDLSFIDANKSSYLDYYEKIVQKTRPGGVILIDDALWKGEVTQETQSTKSQLMCELNQYVSSDKRVENVLIPIRHGINLIYKL